MPEQETITPLVRIEHLSKSYGKTKAVDDISIDIVSGELLGLLGPNGAGKTTTISMLFGLLAMDSGSIWFSGADMKHHSAEARRKMGLIPQEVAIYSGLSAWENVEFFGRLYGLRGDELRQRVEASLDFVGLSDKSHTRPNTFSGGMKRRLNIACAIVHRPQLIVMDEPTVGIDPQSRNHILDSVREINRAGSTVIYTSHYIEEVEALCTHIAIMDYGRVIAYGTPEEIKAQIPGDETIIIALKQPAQAEALEALANLPRVQLHANGSNHVEIVTHNAQKRLQDVLMVLLNHKVEIEEFQIRERNLETVFLALTGRKLRD